MNTVFLKTNFHNTVIQYNYTFIFFYNICCNMQLYALSVSAIAERTFTRFSNNNRINIL